MRNTCAPAALTAAMLMDRYRLVGWDSTKVPFKPSIQTAARLATEAHRLAPLALAHSIAECNDAQMVECIRRIEAGGNPVGYHAAHRRYRRMMRRIAKLSHELAAFKLRAFRETDPRGGVGLRIESDDPKMPAETNGFGPGWCIFA